MGWHTASEDGGPTSPFTWAQPGEATPEAHVDTRIVRERRRRDEHERLTAELSALEARLAALTSPSAPMADERLRMLLRDMVTAVTRRQRPDGRPSSPRERREDRRRRERARALEERSRVEARRGKIAERLTVLGGAHDALLDALLDKATVATGARREGYGQIAWLCDRVHAGRDEQRRIGDALTNAHRARERAWDAYLGWRRVGALVRDHDLVRVSADLPEIHSVRHALAGTRDAIGDLRDRLADLGIEALSSWPSGLRSLDFTVPDCAAGAMTLGALMGRAAGDQVDQVVAMSQQRMLHGLINSIAADTASLADAEARTAQRIRTDMDALERILTRPS